jgi:DegV family protein with EDD domain
MPGSRRIAVVTDSTAYLPEGVAEKYDIDVVALHVCVDSHTGREGIEVRPAEVATALSAHRTVTTSRPTPADFAAAYEAAAASGADAIVSVHLSGALSGTVDSARIAAGSSTVPVRVIDSRTTGMGLGFAVIAAAEAATADAAIDEVVRVAEATARATRTRFYVDTLEHLRRGGRIGPAAALLGSALMIKPLLQFEDGVIAPLEKVRTSARAIARLADVSVDQVGDRPVDVAVHHLAAPARADALASTLRSRLPGLQLLYLSEVGAVVGAHVGPGMLAVVVSPR